MGASILRVWGFGIVRKNQMGKKTENDVQHGFT